jgi:hypothetical protein
MDGFNSKIDSLKHIIRETPPLELQERVYISFANICLLVTAFMNQNGKQGWSSTLLNERGEPMLGKEEQETVENAMSQPWILEFLKSTSEPGHLSSSSAQHTQQTQKQKQKGGSQPTTGTRGNPPHLTSSGSSIVVNSIVNPAVNYLSTITGDDVSLDLMLERFIQETQKMDDFWTKFAQESPGIAKKMNRDVTVYVPTPSGVPIPVPIPVKPIVYFLMMLLDSFRLSRSLMGEKDVPLTILVLIEELITGQWRQMILTCMGFISPSGVSASVIGKYLINTWVLINPEIRSDILRDIYKGNKSLLIGFLLWCLTVLPPQAAKNVLESGLARARKFVENIDDKIKELEEKGSAQLKPFGKKLQFQGVNLGPITRVTMQDIQNLQVLAQWPLLICSKDYQDIQQILEKDPIFRVILELVGVPTTAHDKFKACRTTTYEPLSDVIEDALEPHIVENTDAVMEGANEGANEGTKETPTEIPVTQVPTAPMKGGRSMTRSMTRQQTPRKAKSATRKTRTRTRTRTTN